MIYRKKPVLVDAFQLTDDAEMITPDWFVQAVIDGVIYINRGVKDGHMHVYGCNIRTLEGRMKADFGDYIIRGVNNEIYPCKAEIFHKTYEPA